MTNIDKVRELANTANGFMENYSAIAGEYIRIEYTDDDAGCFFGTGEVSGEEYRIDYGDVDLSNTKFFKLMLMPMN